MKLKAVASLCKRVKLLPGLTENTLTHMCLSRRSYKIATINSQTVILTGLKEYTNIINQIKFPFFIYSLLMEAPVLFCFQTDVLDEFLSSHCPVVVLLLLGISFQISRQDTATRCAQICKVSCLSGP